MPTIFLRIAWMKEYKGVTKLDKPQGAGSHIEEYEDGGEVYNFYPVNGRCYGYVRVQGGKNIRLERLNATKQDEFSEKVTIIFFAKDPERGGQYIIGWYEKATLYRTIQKLKENSRFNYYSYQAVSLSRNSKLIKVEDRQFPIPENGPGQSNVWYVEEYSDKSFLAEVKKYIANPNEYISRIPKRKPTGTPWQKDIELRKQVENEAMKIVAEYFNKRGYVIDYVQNQHLGWDLEATSGEQTLLLEVKGLSGDFATIELTHNEYTNAKRNKKHYRICIVSNALNKKRKLLDVYYKDKNNWVSNENKVLSVQELTGARFYK